MCLEIVSLAPTIEKFSRPLSSESTIFEQWLRFCQWVYLASAVGDGSSLIIKSYIFVEKGRPYDSISRLSFRTW